MKPKEKIKEKPKEKLKDNVLDTRVIVVIGDDYVSQLNFFMYDNITPRNRIFVHVPEFDSLTRKERLLHSYKKIRFKVGYWRNRNERIVSWQMGPKWLRDDHWRHLNICESKVLEIDMTMGILKKNRKIKLDLLKSGIWYEEVDLKFLANLFKVLSRNTIVAIAYVELI